MSPPTVLRGHQAIAAHIGISTRQVDHLARHRQLPTFRLPRDGTMLATAAGLDDWLRVDAVKALLD